MPKLPIQRTKSITNEGINLEWNEDFDFNLESANTLGLNFKLSLVNEADGLDLGSESLKVGLLYNDGKGINDIFYIFDPVTKKASGKIHLQVTFTTHPEVPKPNLAI